MKGQLIATGAINFKDRRTRKTHIGFEEAQWLTVLPKGREETIGLFPRKLDHPHFGHHDRPAKNRSNREQKQDHFARDGRVVEGENDSTCREEATENQIRHPGLVIAKVVRKKSDDAESVVREQDQSVQRAGFAAAC